MTLGSDLDAIFAQHEQAIADAREEAAQATATAEAARAETGRLAGIVADLSDRVAKVEAGTPPPPPPPVPTGVPFSAASPWNQAVQVTPNAARTQAFRTGARLWLNSTSNSHPIFRAKATDPVMTFVDTTHRGDPSWPGPTTLTWPVPANAAPAPGDGHMHIISPDGTKVLETIYAAKSATGWTCKRMHVVDLAGTGMGPMNGTRAYGGSAIGGLITAADITAGKIAHPLAVALPNSLLHFSGGKAGYDSRGYGTALGYVPPATEQDYDSPWAYKGPIPMGTRLSIPATADLSSLSPEVRLIGQALKDYGAMIVDRCGDGDICFYSEPTVPSSWVSALLGPSWSRTEIQKLMPLIAVA